MNSHLCALAGTAALSLLVGCSGTEAFDDPLIDTDETAIVGGANANIADHPWQVSLQTSSGFHFCGGVILSDRWILTAQHCVDFTGAALIGPPSSLRIAAGASQLSAMTTSGQTRSIEDIITYPGYVDGSQGKKGKDIALLRLASPLTLGPSVQPIAMATPSDEAAGLANPGVLAKVSGWGHLSAGGSLSGTLQTVEVPIVSNSNAQTFYPMETITADQLAAGDTGNGGEDACQGDSGGPLTVAKGSSRILAGVVSWGYGCAEAQHPGLYARAASFRSWISSALASTPVVLDSRTNLSGSAATWQHFTINVPAGTPMLNVHSSGGTGNADLYVRYGSQPTTSIFDCRPFMNDSNESCNFNNPAAGTWHVSLRGASSSFSGVSLKSTSYNPNGQSWLTAQDGKALAGDSMAMAVRIGCAGIAAPSGGRCVCRTGPTPSPTATPGWEWATATQ
ncbi:trypsin-like serine protease [Sorangium sp. So ce291]|uniref:trypsin-like serine protease n=1 Tax=Sorangium sp. So ce291 TaxID=3133294 RepID=UPI003F5EF5B7